MSYLRLRQVCLVASELETAVADLRHILDLHVCHRDPNLARYGLENVIFAIGDRFVEIVAPIREGTTAERFLHRSGGKGGYMAIFDCDDPVGRAEHCADLGVVEVNRVRVESYLGVQLHPRDCRAAMIEFNHTEGGEPLDGPYWPAGEDWRESPTSTVARTLTGVDLETPVPEDLAGHWARILELPLDHSDDTPTLESGGAALRFLHGDGERECLSALHLNVKGVDDVLARAGERGYTVRDGRFRLAGVDWCPKAGR
ncbi:hypothetical protein CEK62_17980 [Alcanivorax sp. N3-2A]|nr:hypothetical protein CEK62_17980 [Alcanivorax sp. N3-2A]